MIFTRTSVQLYRDCLRLIRHVAPGASNRKGMALRSSVKSQFRANALAEGEKLEDAKAQAVRALSNYMLQHAAQKDPNMHANMKQFHRKQVQQAVDFKKQSNNEETLNREPKQSYNEVKKDDI